MASITDKLPANQLSLLRASLLQDEEILQVERPAYPFTLGRSGGTLIAICSILSMAAAAAFLPMAEGGFSIFLLAGLGLTGLAFLLFVLHCRHLDMSHSYVITSRRVIIMHRGKGGKPFFKSFIIHENVISKIHPEMAGCGSIIFTPQTPGEDAVLGFMAIPRLDAACMLIREIASKY